MELSGKKAIICGGTLGIGDAIAKLFASKGCDLVLISHNKSNLKARQEEIINKFKVKVEFLIADFDNNNLVKKVISNYFLENNDINILVNNVGSHFPNKIIDSSSVLLRKVFERHVLSAHEITLATVKSMISQNISGKIINICANTSIAPYPELGLSSIRAAEIYWAKSLALELAQYQITVNNILPGPTDTDGLKNIIKILAQKEGITYEEKSSQIIKTLPFKRYAKPIEIAHAALFLASDNASYITGANIKVDGGFNIAT